MTRRYEIVYIFDSALEEPQVDEQLERLHALLKSDESPDPILNVSHWGKRTLAYPINGNEIGYYVVVQFSTDPTLLPEFERLVKLEERIIRYQIVLNEGTVPEAAPVPGGGDEKSGDEKRSDEQNAPEAGAHKTDDQKAGDQ